MVCEAKAAENPTERMATREERIAAQVELLQSTAKIFVELEGVSERCANLHGNLALEKFKAERGWVPLPTDDRMTAYYSASTRVCPSNHVILN